MPNATYAIGEQRFWRIDAPSHTNPLPRSTRLLQELLPRVRPAWVASKLKSFLRLHRTVVDTSYGRFWVDPVSNCGVELTRTGLYEPAMLGTMLRFLRPNSTFVDLGANEGYFTVVGAKLCGPMGRVVAVEPQERLRPVLAENLRLNGIDWARVRHAAISDRSGSATIYLAPDLISGTSGMHRRLHYNLPTQDVETLTLAQLLEQEELEQVDVMKIDVEGWEYEAVLGSPAVFREHRVGVLAMDLHPAILEERHKQIDDILNLLGDAGYRLLRNFGNTVWLSPRCAE